MFIPTILAISFFIGFLVESIVGLGGTLIAYSIMLFFYDPKELMISTIFLSFIASFFVLFSEYKSISFNILKRFIPFCLLGIPVGILLFEYLPGYIVIKFLAGFLILFGIRTLFFGDIKAHGLVRYLIVFISGIIHGLIGTGGPVAIIGMKQSFRNKKELRSTMAVFFIILNLCRIIQFGIIYKDVKIMLIYWWVAFPVLIGVLIGYQIHKKISEEKFKSLLAMFFILMGIMLMFR
jgi:uncharacterized membrane protein YfcA